MMWSLICARSLTFLGSLFKNLWWIKFRFDGTGERWVVCSHIRRHALSGFLSFHDVITAMDAWFLALFYFSFSEGPPMLPRRYLFVGFLLIVYFCYHVWYVLLYCVIMLLVIKLSRLALVEVPQIWLPSPFDMVFLGCQDVWDSSCVFLSFSLSWLFFHVQQEKKNIRTQSILCLRVMVILNNARPFKKLLENMSSYRKIEEESSVCLLLWYIHSHQPNNIASISFY